MKGEVVLQAALMRAARVQSHSLDVIDTAEKFAAWLREKPAGHPDDYHALLALDQACITHREWPAERILVAAEQYYQFLTKEEKPDGE